MFREKSALRERLPAKAVADRKESDLAAGSAEKAEPESESLAALPAFQERVLKGVLLVPRHFRKLAADAAAQIEELREEPEPRRESHGLPEKPPLPVHAWEPKVSGKVQQKLRPRVPGRFPLPWMAIRSIPRSAGA